MTKIYGYIRVSTQKQGEGVSLDVQREDIINYALKHDLKIIEWFEEKKSASKGQRPKFNQMIQNLYDDKAEGFIAHKIDRMMRNRHDWAVINDLMDLGKKVISADRTSMEDCNGRFMGDIQAAVATRYSSNLSQESKKGLYGRLKQGIYPFGAPIGYINHGSGKVKTIDQVKAPLIKKLFRLYVNKGYSASMLVVKMFELGLRNSRGKKISKNGILTIIKNPFYTGMMKVKGQTFSGKHKPIISACIYKKAQDIRTGKINRAVKVHDFLFRRAIKCMTCKYTLSGETQKGHIYYRCHTKGCTTKSMNQNSIDLYIRHVLQCSSISIGEWKEMNKMLHTSKAHWIKKQEGLIQSLNLRIGGLDAKIERLTELLVECIIDAETYKSENGKLLTEKQELLDQKSKLMSQKERYFTKIQNFLELAKKPIFYYELSNFDEKREFLKLVTSNLQVEGKRVMFSMVSPFYTVANRDILSLSALDKDKPRTSDNTISYVSKNTSPIIPAPLEGEKLRAFYHYLLANAAYLPDLTNIIDHEIPTDNPSTE